MANTTNQGWSKPTVGGSEDTWGATINTTLDAIDTLVGPITAAEIAKLDGMTSSTAELNKLTGVTSTPAELNLVAGLTASTAELDHVTGVTSAIQTQIDSKQSVDATLTALAGLATGANKVPYSTGTDTFSQLDFKDEDNMASDSATAVPSQQSVKAYVDTSAITKTSGSAPYYGVRSWCKFDGTGSIGVNCTLNGSGNVASVLKTNSGTFTLTFSTAMPDANYSITFAAGQGSTRSDAEQPSINVFSQTSAGFEFVTTDATGNTYQDYARNYITVVG